MKTLKIGHLYPATMSTYGDAGNILCLRKRAAWRGIKTELIPLEIGEPIPAGIDLYFFGGGQDAAQTAVGRDLREHRAERLRQDAAAGVPMLAICGGYQLLGDTYLPADADPISGISLLPVRTEASKKRMIGDLVIRQSLGLENPTVVGFENHSGKTFLLSDEARPLGSVLRGHGNNGDDGSEGCVLHNVIGCYLHGPLLPKNPHVADWLLEQAMQRHTPGWKLGTLDDTAEWAAHRLILGRHRLS